MSTDASPKLSDFSPPSDLDSYEEYLDRTEAELAEIIEPVLHDILIDAATTYLDTNDPAAFDPIQRRWDQLVTDAVLPLLERIYLEGSLTAWHGFDQTPPPVTAAVDVQYPHTWPQAVRAAAVDWYERMGPAVRSLGLEANWSVQAIIRQTLTSRGSVAEAAQAIYLQIEELSHAQARQIARNQVAAAYNKGE